MILIKLFLFSLVSFSSGDELTQLDNYLGKSELINDFKLNQTIKMVHESCIFSCDSMNSTRKITKVTADEVEITVFGHKGQKISINKISAAVWKELKGNWVRLLLSNKESYGLTCRVSNVTEGLTQVILDNQSKSITGYLVNIECRNNISKTQDKVFVTNQLPGLGQFLYHQWTNSLNPKAHDKLVALKFINL